MKDADMWQRRANLRGAPVRITSIKYPVFSKEFTMDSYGRPIGGKGYLLDMLRMMPKTFNGAHVNHPAVSMERTRRLEIESEEPLWVWADGERITQTPTTIEVVPGALSVMVPR